MGTGVVGEGRALQSLWALFARPGELVGLGCFFGWYQLTRQALMASAAPAMLAIVDNRILFELLVAASLVVAVACAGVRAVRSDGRAGAAAGAVGSLATLLVLISLGAGESTGLCLTALAVSACCSSLLAVLWCWRTLGASADRAIAHVLASVLFARALALACNLPWAPVFWALDAALPLASCLLLARVPELPLPEGGRVSGEDCADVPGLSAVRVALIVLATFLMGLAFGAYKLAYTGLGQSRISSAGLNLAIFALHVAVVSALVLFSRRALFIGSYRATMAVLMLGSAASGAGGMLGALSPALVLWSQFMLMGLVWAIAPGAGLRDGVRGPRLVGWCFAVFYLGSALSSLVLQAVPAAVPSGLRETAMALLACAVVGHFYLFREQDVLALVGDREREHRLGRVALAQGCARVAARFGLTEREADVLGRWVAGEAAPQVAAELCVSESTVRTHVRNIYRKTGAHDRAGLLGLARGE